MQIGKVCGSVWATKKSEQLVGISLLVVRTENKDIIAADTLGAGIGDTVLLVFGSSARRLVGNDVDAAICGIIDNTRKEEEY